MVEIQNDFLLKIAKLIMKADELGFQLTSGEFERPPELAELYASQGNGIKNSLHIQRLAADLNMFKDGTWLDGSENWHIPLITQLGVYWESLGGTWGGRFEKKDYNHFSVEHNGIK